jgi:ATP-binding cassette, subfamily B, bacterial
VRFDGRDIREVTSAALRNQVGIVFQESVLFDTTIRENIRMGQLTATHAEIEAAARDAEIHDVIAALPEGYDTAVGERGSRLSGGQRQRVAIARALVRAPSVLVLDEATSALDPQTEGSVNETIRRLAAGRTVLSVTHRLAPVVHCDRVFVLDRGQVVEDGSHEELLARDGVYARLWNKQRGFTVSDDGETAEITPARLAAVPLFAALEPDLLAELATRMRSDRAEAGQFLMREGETGDRFYVVARGRLEVLKQAGDGHLEQVDIVEDGDYFGEISLLRDVPRTASVRALTPVVYLSLKRDQLLRLLARVPGLRERLDQLIQARLEENAAVARGTAGVVADAPA